MELWQKEGSYFSVERQAGPTCMLITLIPSHSSSVLNSLWSFRAQDASSSDSLCNYHGFLSFRGKDTRKTFTDHLYIALNHRGFRIFRDDDEIEKGENIKFELQKAIQESKMLIVVFSKNYASSSRCLDELVMILKRRRTTGHVVLPVFYHVDPSHVRKQIKSFKKAFTRHEERFHTERAGKKDEPKGKIHEWRSAL
ncbi:TMV resistance protein N-like [Camellia sinensis]|uniref:TMV resistance protein N-like n=1 Tax=Camellia sinensis TaxID=4442 RepID=UPI0010362DB8|nr:TMV resistance protein N-like [Camellia sinensis]